VDYIEIQKLIAPEMLDVVQRRYSLLRTVSHLAPVGRRVLADTLQMGERIVRSELDTLKHMGLIDSSSGGVSLTDLGKKLLAEMGPYVMEIMGLPALGQKVAERLGFARVVVVPGDSSFNPLVQRELGKAASNLLTRYLQAGDIVAVTGGTTMSHMAESIHGEKHQVTVVPGRGALGERVEIQANTIAAKVAQALGGSYKMLHAPDNLSRPALDELMREPGIADALTVIHRATILVHGIGEALEMARRRAVPSEQIEVLKTADAVAETLGFYFDDAGSIVWQANSIGLGLRDLENIKTVIAVAGGSAKARAIRAVAAHGCRHILVTDQGAAEAILSLSPIQ